jgi:putative DNA primase/helicase
MNHQQYVALEAAASDIVRRLGGTWRSGGAMCRCPVHDDKTPSLSVRVGDRSLLFKCFAGCSTIDVLRTVNRLRLAIPAYAESLHIQPPTAISGHASRALEIWERARDICGTLGEAYLFARRIDARPLPLRFHPRTPHGRGRDVRFRPGIIAPICDDHGLVAVQRIFLDQQFAGLAPDMEHPRLTLGRPLAGAVRLAPAGPILGLAEGVETAVSAMILLDIPVWATLGNERLARIAIPDIVDRLILLPDADRAGITAARLATTEYERPGRRIEIRLPFGKCNDWNDALRARRPREGKREGNAVRHAARSAGCTAFGDISCNIPSSMRLP